MKCCGNWAPLYCPFLVKVAGYQSFERKRLGWDVLLLRDILRKLYLVTNL